MAHLALYREWRPQTFADVVGQQHVTRTLKNALALGRLSHAYLFAGPRGTGKTSVARILAKAVNCLHPEDGEPDNTCEACRRITSGDDMDVIEIDAASNRGIDEIRDLRDKVKYAPTVLKYKVYIVDEVHMLTEPAFNALLKTLEEPPSHVIFILATTEAHKVPVTIRSRCQRYDFHRLATAEIVQRLREVCRRHGFTVAEDALAAVARQAEGGMRDALSLLDQLTAYAEPDRPIALADTLAVLGAASVDRFLALDGALVRGDAGGALLLLDDLVREGKDLRQFVRDFLGHLRDLLILKVSEDHNLLELPAAQIQQLQDQAGQFDQAKLMAALQLLAAAENDLRHAANPRLLVEVGLIRLCALPPEPAAAAAPTRPAPAGDFLAPPSPAPAADPPARPPRAAAATAPAADTPELREVRAAWPEVLELFASTAQAKPLVPFLKQATPCAVEGMTLVLGFPPGPDGRTARDMVNKRLNWVQRALTRQNLPEYRVATTTVETAPPAADERPPDLISLLRQRVPPDVPVEEVKEDDR